MNSKKKTYRFGWVDWMLLLVVCCVVFAGVYYWKTKRKNADQRVHIVYTLCIPNMERSLITDAPERFIPINGMAMNQNGTMDLGRVLSVRMRPVLQPVLKNREVQFVEVPNRVDLWVSIRADAVWKPGDGFRVGDIRLAVGKQGDFRIGGVFASGASVMHIEREEV